LRLLAEQSLGSDEAVETIFFMPAHTFPRKVDSRERMPWEAAQALLFTGHGLLHIQEGETAGQPASAVYIPADQLFYTRLTLILLYGQLEFFGFDGTTLQKIQVRYNAVRHDLLWPVLQRFLRSSWEKQPHPAMPDQTESLLQTLEAQSYKFRNGLTIFALQPEEQLLDFVYQPRIQRRSWGIFKRLIAPAALLAITEYELIFMEEGRTNPTQYGWYITFCQRSFVERIEIKPNAAWQDACFHVRKDTSTAEFRMMFENNAAQVLHSKWMSQTW
jgi:hypothetical protein